MSGESGTPPHKRRIVLCMGPYCNQGWQAEVFYERLQRALGDPGPSWMTHKPITWETANCLSMCGAGPNLVIYPDELCYHHLNPRLLEDILQQLMSDGPLPEAKE
jgi:(2Fe-2S) ferredoxin